MEYSHVTHEDFGPEYDEKSRILILGSVPSVKSRELAFYYGHPQNRFWRVLYLLKKGMLRDPNVVREGKGNGGHRKRGYREESKGRSENGRGRRREG